MIEDRKRENITDEDFNLRRFFELPTFKLTTIMEYMLTVYIRVKIETSFH